MDSNTLFENKVKEGHAFFFAGSGISYESFLPSAGKVLLKTAELFFPLGIEFTELKNKIIQDENNYSIQPEIFYENLLYFSTSPTGSENHLSPLRFETFNRKVF